MVSRLVAVARGEVGAVAEEGEAVALERGVPGRGAHAFALACVEEEMFINYILCVRCPIGGLY